MSGPVAKPGQVWRMRSPWWHGGDLIHLHRWITDYVLEGIHGSGETHEFFPNMDCRADHIADDIDPRIITTPAREDGYPAACVRCGGTVQFNVCGISGIYFCAPCFGSHEGDWMGFKRQWDRIRRQPAKVEAKQEPPACTCDDESKPCARSEHFKAINAPKCKFDNCTTPVTAYGTALCPRHNSLVEASNVGKSPVGWLRMPDRLVEGWDGPKRFEVPPEMPACNASWRLR